MGVAEETAIARGDFPQSGQGANRQAQGPLRRKRRSLSRLGVSSGSAHLPTRLVSRCNVPPSSARLPARCVSRLGVPPDAACPPLGASVLHDGTTRSNSRQARAEPALGTLPPTRHSSQAPKRYMPRSCLRRQCTNGQGPPTKAGADTADRHSQPAQSEAHLEEMPFGASIARVLALKNRDSRAFDRLSRIFLSAIRSIEGSSRISSRWAPH